MEDGNFLKKFFYVTKVDPLNRYFQYVQEKPPEGIVKNGGPSICLNLGF